MSTIRPRTPCILVRRSSAYTFDGRPRFEERRKHTKCAVIWLHDDRSETTVRADSSATRGRAEEIQYEAKLLLFPKEDVKTGDLVRINLGGGEVVIEINRIHRRMDVEGKAHHIEIEGNRWASAS